MKIPQNRFISNKPRASKNHTKKSLRKNLNNPRSKKCIWNSTFPPLEVFPTLISLSSTPVLKIFALFSFNSLSIEFFEFPNDFENFIFHSLCGNSHWKVGEFTFGTLSPLLNSLDDSHLTNI